MPVDLPLPAAESVRRQIRHPTPAKTASAKPLEPMLPQPRLLSAREDQPFDPPNPPELECPLMPLNAFELPPPPLWFPQDELPELPEWSPLK